MTQLLTQEPSGFLPRVYYGLVPGENKYKFVKDYIFNVDGLTGDVGDAYGLLSPSEISNYINAIAIQINPTQLQIVIQGDYNADTSDFNLVNQKNGDTQALTLENVLSLQEASFLGSYDAQNNKDKQITVLYDMEFNAENVVFASVDYSGDGVYNWVRVGNYQNGINGKDGITPLLFNDVYTYAREMLPVENISLFEDQFNRVPMVGDVVKVVAKTKLEPVRSYIALYKVIEKGRIAYGRQQWNCQRVNAGTTYPWYVETTGQTGATGANGANGISPTIVNGTWHLGDVDTGVKAEGVDGTNGADGKSFAIQSGLFSTMENEGKEGNISPEGELLRPLPTLPSDTISGNGYVVYDPITTPLTPYYDLYWANNGDTEWTIMHPFSGIAGKDGTNGETPYIQNNQWWIGTTNTGVQATGDTGATGVGITDVQVTPSTDADPQGILYNMEVTLSDGQTITAGDFLSPKGETGAQGAVGPTGATPNITASATALPGGSAPTVTVGGTPENPIMNFGIPSPVAQSTTHGVKFSDGTILNWGNSTTDSNGNWSATYEIPYTTTPYVVCSTSIPQTTNTLWAPRTRNNTGTINSIQGIVTARTSSANNYSNGSYVNWLAIGR